MTEGAVPTRNPAAAGPRFHVGQTVHLGNWRRQTAYSPVVITKIGRKYATALYHGREYRFDLITGRGDSQPGYFIKTDADLAEGKARKEAAARLIAVGFRHTGDFPRNLSAAALNQIADIAAADLDIEIVPVNEEARSDV